MRFPIIAAAFALCLSRLCHATGLVYPELPIEIEAYAVIADQD